LNVVFDFRTHFVKHLHIIRYPGSEFSSLNVGSLCDLYAIILERRVSFALILKFFFRFVLVKVTSQIYIWKISLSNEVLQILSVRFDSTLCNFDISFEFVETYLIDELVRLIDLWEVLKIEFFNNFLSLPQSMEVDSFFFGDYLNDIRKNH
jgi:hypothetical protein